MKECVFFVVAVLYFSDDNGFAALLHKGSFLWNIHHNRIIGIFCTKSLCVWVKGKLSTKDFVLVCNFPSQGNGFK